MKKLLVYLVIFNLMIIGGFIGLVGLTTPKHETAEDGSININIEYSGNGKMLIIILRIILMQIK